MTLQDREEKYVAPAMERARKFFEKRRAVVPRRIDDLLAPLMPAAFEPRSTLAAVDRMGATRIADATERIRTVSVDDLALTNVRLMKIDTEGMEHKVLGGAVGTIERSRPVLFFEYTKTDFEWIRSLLRHLDYRAYYAQRPNVLAFPAEFTDIELKGARSVEAG